MKVLFSRLAQADIAEIHGYIARRNPRAAKSVAAAIERSTVQLELFPESGRRGAVAGSREIVVRGLPYIVVYRLAQEAAGEPYVEVLAVYHAARNEPRGG